MWLPVLTLLIVLLVFPLYTSSKYILAPVGLEATYKFPTVLVFNVVLVVELDVVVVVMGNVVEVSCVVLVVLVVVVGGKVVDVLEVVVSVVDDVEVLDVELVVDVVVTVYVIVQYQGLEDSDESK